MPDIEGPLLPSAFASLERYAPIWDLPDTNARYAKRLESTLNDLKRFFEDMMARVNDIKTYLDTKSFADYTDQDRRLARLMFALGVVGPAVEMFKQPAVPDTASSTFLVLREWEF
jgi:hypothetical protein